MYSIGVDLGGTNIAIGLCDAELKLVDKGSVPTPQNDPEKIVKEMAALARLLIDRNGVMLGEVEYVGIAVPGAADDKSGTVIYTPNLPFKDYQIAEVFKKFLPVQRVILANDANAAALGEALAGAARGAAGCIMVTLGTGVGGGIIINGKIFSGSLNSLGAEIGHTVIAAGGRQCGCGRRGCWEAYSSATALKNMTSEKMQELSLKGIPSLLFEEAEKEGKVSARTAFNAMKRADTHAKAVVDEYIYYLGTGIANMINIFQPEVVIIGGGVSGERENLTAPLSAMVNAEQYTRNSEKKAKIVTATLGNDAGIIGAAGLGR